MFKEVLSFQSQSSKLRFLVNRRKLLSFVFQLRGHQGLRGVSIFDKFCHLLKEFVKRIIFFYQFVALFYHGSVFVLVDDNSFLGRRFSGGDPADQLNDLKFQFFVVSEKHVVDLRRFAAVFFGRPKESFFDVAEFFDETFELFAFGDGSDLLGDHALNFPKEVVKIFGDFAVFQFLCHDVAVDYGKELLG